MPTGAVIDPDMLCPGDIISFQCRIFSSLDLYLEWRVTVPGLMPENVTYDNSTSIGTMTDWDMNITSELTSFEPGDHVESVIVLTLSEEALRRNTTTTLEC